MKHERLIEAINKQRYEDVTTYLQQYHVTAIDLSGDTVRNIDVEKLAHALIGTPVRSLDLSRQDHGYQNIIKLCIALQRTAIIELKLSSTLFGEGHGIEMIFEALTGSPIQKVNFSHNNIPEQKVGLIASYIPQTCLIEVNLGFESKALQNALRENQERMHLAGYEASLDEESDLFCQNFSRYKLLLKQNIEEVTTVSFMEKSRRNSL